MNKDQLLGAMASKKSIPLDVEGVGRVFVNELSPAAYIHYCLEIKNNAEAYNRAYLVVHSVVDEETGQLMFSEKDIDEIQNNTGGKALARLSFELMILNGLAAHLGSETPLESELKNSDSAQPE